MILALDDGTVVAINPDSTFALSELDGDVENPITRFFMNVGEVFAFRLNDEPLPDDAAFEVETPTGIAAIRGSSMGVMMAPQTQAGSPLVVVCLTGHCIVVNVNDDEIDLTAGEKIDINDLGEFGEVVVIDADDLSAGQLACVTAQGAGHLHRLPRACLGRRIEFGDSLVLPQAIQIDCFTNGVVGNRRRGQQHPRQQAMARHQRFSDCSTGIRLPEVMCDRKTSSQ